MQHNNQDTIYITSQGLKKLQEELADLIQIKRPAVTQRIKDAKELGDLSENAEYITAREEQSVIEGRIMETQDILKKVQVVAAPRSKQIVKIGSRLRVKSNSKVFEYTIVGSTEANPAKGEISNESPLGRGFLGKQKSETVEISVPAGKIKFTIMEIF